MCFRLDCAHVYLLSNARAWKTTHEPVRAPLRRKIRKNRRGASSRASDPLGPEPMSNSCHPVVGRRGIHLLSSSGCPNGLISQESHCVFRHSVSSVHPNHCTATAHSIQPFPVTPSVLMPFFSPWILSIGVNNHIGRCRRRDRRVALPAVVPGCIVGISVQNAPSM